MRSGRPSTRNDPQDGDGAIAKSHHAAEPNLIVAPASYRWIILLVAWM
jgi:hypothetical protein